MEFTEEVLAQIGAYLSGRMTESERQAFDAKLEQDLDLQREVIIQHELKQGLSLLDQKQRFKAMHTDLMQRQLLTQPATDPEAAPSVTLGGNVIPLHTHRPTFWQNRSYMTVAASLLILAGISWLFFWKQSIPSAEAIQRDKAFYSVFTPDLKSAPPVFNDPDRLGAAQPNPSESQDSLELLKGITFLERRQPQPAINQLQPIAQGIPGHWRASAQWYLALAYLKNGQVTQTDSLLALIAQSNGHPYQLEARRLTEQLPHHSTSPN